MFSKLLFGIFFKEMIFFERYVLVLFLFFCRNGVRAGDSGLVINKNIYNNDFDRQTDFNEESSTQQVGDEIKWKNLKEEVFKELNQLNFRKQREIFEDLKKQHEEMNTSQKKLASLELQSLSPLNVEELKNIKKAIKSSNNTLPAIRNKRTLNFLLLVVAKAMGISLIPKSFNVQWSPRTNQPPPSTSSPPCSSTPTCKLSPPLPSPAACFQPTTASFPRLSTSTQSPTIPPNQINANTISYPFRPASTIPLFNFAPLPAGVSVPYPPLLQPPTRQPPPCARAQPPSTSSCGGTSQPSTPSPCPALTSSSTSPCGMSATPSSQPCAVTAASRPPCATSPIYKSSQPCTPPSSQTPSGTSSPSPPSCAPPTSQSSPPTRSSAANVPKNSIFLEYDNPVRIHIFSNEKKYLPASGSIYRGQENDYEENSHSNYFPSNEENRNKGESEEEEDEEEREEIVDKPMRFRDDEEEEENEAGEEKDGQNRKSEYPERKYGEWNSYGNGQKEEENDSDDEESETSLSLVKNPMEQQVQRRRRISLKQANPLAKDINLSTKNYGEESTLMEKKAFEETERVQSLKKPKNTKWVRIVKKQRKKIQRDSHPQDNFHIYTSNMFPKSSFVSHKILSSNPLEQGSQHEFNMDFTNSLSQNVRNITLTGLENTGFKKEGSKGSKSVKRVRRYKENRPKYYEIDIENEKRNKLEKAVERYIEDYIEKQLGQEIIKNTGIPKTTVLEFVPKNGPRIQTITTTVAKTNYHVPRSNPNYS